jgi:biopolymer transport protein ExbB
MSWLLLAASFARAEDAPAGTLEAAYQKEYAYLLAERDELRARIQELERDGAARTQRADRELEELQARLVASSRAADRAEDEFDALERAAGAMADAEVLLSTTVSQAAETLGLPAQADAGLGVPVVFAAAAAHLRAVNAVAWSDGEFFLPSGEAVKGRILRAGQVAAWGVAPPSQGSLAPAGEGRLQLRQSWGQATAAAFAAGSAPDSLQVQLFEPERGAEEAEKEGGLGPLLRDSGTMGQILFGLGVVSGTLVFVRALTLAFARRGGQPLVDVVVRHCREGRTEDALAQARSRGGPTARVLAAIVDNASRKPEELDRVVDEAILRETPIVDRFASALVVITAGSPLLGLLGTVTGMIATFNVITEHGTGNPKLMSAGIAEALICTAFGLAVAIPTLIAGNVLATVAEGIKNVIERGALATLNALEEGRPGRRPRETGEPPLHVVHE